MGRLRDRGITLLCIFYQPPFKNIAPPPIYYDGETPIPSCVKQVFEIDISSNQTSAFSHCLFKVCFCPKKYDLHIKLSEDNWFKVRRSRQVWILFYNYKMKLYCNLVGHSMQIAIFIYSDAIQKLLSRKIWIFERKGFHKFRSIRSIKVLLWPKSIAIFHRDCVYIQTNKKRLFLLGDLVAQQQSSRIRLIFGLVSTGT